jgi:hypothetical protein
MVVPLQVSVVHWIPSSWGSSGSATSDVPPVPSQSRSVQSMELWYCAAAGVFAAVSTATHILALHAASLQTMPGSEHCPTLLHSTQLPWPSQ